MDLYSIYCKEIQYFERLFECAKENEFWLNLHIGEAKNLPLWITKIKNTVVGCGGCDILSHHLYFDGFVKTESGKIKKIEMGIIKGWGIMCKCHTKLDYYMNDHQKKWLEISVPYNSGNKWFRYCISSQSMKYSLSLPKNEELILFSNE